MQSAKSGNLTQMQHYHQIHSTYCNALNFPVMSFTIIFFPHSRTKSRFLPCIYLSCLFSLLQPEMVSQFFFVSLDLDIWPITLQKVLHFGFFWCFLILWFRLTFFSRNKDDVSSLLNSLGQMWHWFASMLVVWGLKTNLAGLQIQHHQHVVTCLQGALAV